MGYLFLSFALMAGIIKGYCGKKVSDYASNIKKAVLINTVRMAFCLVFSVALILLSDEVLFLTLNPSIIFISAISGISTAVFLITWLLVVRKSAYMMVDIFLMLGTLVPMLCGYFSGSEAITPKQWIGYMILLVAVVFMQSYNNSIKEKITLPSFLLLLACGFANGITDLSQKTFITKYPHIPVSVFNLYTYFFAALVLGIFCIITLKSNTDGQTKIEGPRKYLIYILIMSVALVVNSIFKTLAAAHLDSAQLYPLNQGTALILSTLMAAIFFKEKIKPKCIIGISLAFIGLLIMNVL